MLKKILTLLLFVTVAVGATMTHATATEAETAPTTSSLSTASSVTPTELPSPRSERLRPDGGGGSTSNGCLSKVQKRGDSWTARGWFWKPSVSRVPKLINVNFHATLIYLYCPNLDRPAKIIAKEIDWCWFQPESEEHNFFTGVTNNAKVRDNQGTVTDPGPFKVSDDGTRQNCNDQKIDPNKQRWMRVAHRPVWYAKSTINLIGLPDQSFTYKNGSGGETNKIDPGNSQVLSGWF
jgi:hypothetical protein